jgi:YVTN family beta-propeller protein
MTPSSREENSMTKSKILAISSMILVLSSLNAYSADKVYVANQDSDTVSVIDVESLAVVENISVGDIPHNVNHTTDRSLVLVTNKNLNVSENPSLSIISSATDRVLDSIENIGSRVEHVVAIGSDRAYVTEDLERNAVAVIDIPQRRIINFIEVGVKPHGLWPTPEGDALFVPNQLSGTLNKIDVSSGKVVGEAQVGRTPTMAAVSPDGNFVYVTLYGERSVAVVNAGLVESGRLQINDLIAVGEHPAQVAVTPDGKYVLVPCEGPGSLYVIDTSTHTVVANIATGAGAHGVDVSEDSNLAFVANREPGTVSVINLDNLTLLKQIKVGDNPAGIDFVRGE